MGDVRYVFGSHLAAVSFEETIDCANSAHLLRRMLRLPILRENFLIGTDEI